MKKLTKAEKSWILYDCGNSAFSIAITTAILPIFFKSTISSHLSPSMSTAYWGYTNTIAIIIVALLAPILGTIADYKGHKKRFFFFFALLGILGTVALSTLGEGDLIPCLVIYAIATVGFSAANVFYDSFLTDVAEDENMDKVSSYGFAFGYIASMIPFTACMLFIFKYKFFGITVLQATRLSFIITALWWFLLTIPMFKNVKQIHYIDKEKHLVVNAFKRLFKTFKKIKHHKYAALFLLAYFFYIDGVHTIIKMSTVFSQDIGISSNAILGILLMTQIVAFPSAIIFAKLADVFSAKAMLFYGIFVYTFITLFAYFIQTATGFFILGFLVGTAQGGMQALSRSTYGKLIPKEQSAEFYGLYNILGKASAALGPSLIAFITALTGNTRYGILSLLPLFVIGAILLSKVPLSKKQTNKTLNA